MAQMRSTQGCGFGIGMMASCVTSLTALTISCFRFNRRRYRSGQRLAPLFNNPFPNHIDYVRIASARHEKTILSLKFNDPKFVHIPFSVIGDRFLSVGKQNHTRKAWQRANKRHVRPLSKSQWFGNVSREGRLGGSEYTSAHQGHFSAVLFLPTFAPPSLPLGRCNPLFLLRNSLSARVTLYCAL